MSQGNKNGFSNVGYDQEEWYFHWHNLKLMEKLKEKQSASASEARAESPGAEIIPFRRKETAATQPAGSGHKKAA